MFFEVKTSNALFTLTASLLKAYLISQAEGYGESLKEKKVVNTNASKTINILL